MLTKSFIWLEQRLDKGRWFRRAFGVSTFVLAFKLTEWATEFADKVLDKGSDLMGAAGLVAAVAGVPIALLTIIFKSYVETREGNGPGT